MYNAFSNPDGLGQWSGMAWQNSIDIGDLILITVIFLGMNGGHEKLGLQPEIS